MTKTATVKARIPGATAVDLLLDDNIGLTSPATIAGTEGDDDVWSFVLTGLTADFTYFYGFDGSAVVGTFTTPDDDGAEFSFTIATSACAGHSGGEYVTDDVSNSPAFARIVDRTPLMFVHMGDRHYRDISTNNVTSFRNAYADVMAASEQHALHLAMPVAYQWDDHDFGPDQSYSGSASKPAAQQVYREHVPHWPLPSATATYQTFVIGRVRFFLLDVRSERTINTATDNASKTMLGATQKQWLKDELLAATEPVLVVFIGSSWITTSSGSWSSFGTERQELAEYFTDNSLTEKLLLVGSDWHWTAADNGTNSQKDPGALPPGPPMLNFGPLDAGWSSNNGTYSEGIFKDSHQQYGTIEFDDQSTDIVVTAKGWAVDPSSETEMFSLDLTYPA